MKPDGGPAFPAGDIATGPVDRVRQDGMSLRDYFAAHLAPVVVASTLKSTAGNAKEATTFLDNAITLSFTLADKMLAEREKS